MDQATVTLFTFLGILLGAAIGFWISYALIKAAVKGGTEQITELLQKQLRIEKRRMEKEGLNEAEIASILTKD
jgi:uncharacterized protein YneF (UPF0154 family)